jgi:hypothetical protein
MTVNGDLIQIQVPQCIGVDTLWQLPARSGITSCQMLFHGVNSLVTIDHASREHAAFMRLQRI